MTTKVKVLLVDDNPMVMFMLRQALAPLATVSCASNGVDAVRITSSDLPDLIISDYQMPGMDGRQLLEKIRESRSTGGIPFILMAGKADINESLKPLQDSVEDFIEKPFFIKDAKARIKRVIDRISLEKMTKEAPGKSVVRGSLSQMSVIDLLQSLELGRKTCQLTLSDNRERCQVFLSEGQISHAVYGPLIGDEAIYRVLTWTDPSGSFDIDFAVVNSQQTTTRSTQGLLMEGLRLLDEANRDNEGDLLET